MLFSSPTFFVFFAIYYLLHRVTPLHLRVYLIIVGSTVFYGWWKVEYVWLPYLLTIVAYIGARSISKSTDHADRRRNLVVTLLVLFLPLFVFKYTNFFLVDVFHLSAGRLANWVLPLGVSFVTFTLTAYVVDIYHSRYHDDGSFKSLLAYVLFFPHLIAGPILRPIELLPQINHPRRMWAGGLLFPVALFTLGLTKKLLFADQIGEAVDRAYQIANPTPLDSLFALYGFSVQIYCDFSGYTDMALGLALLLGIRLPINFNRPYSASNLIEFWRRWHITLSSWLRDYLYISLGGNRCGKARQAMNLLVTMILGGLWHGANWTFVFWGGLHGAALAITHYVARLTAHGKRTALPGWLAKILTYHFVVLAWVLFRSPSTSDAARVLGGLTSSQLNPDAFISIIGIFPVILIAVFHLLHRFDDHRRLRWAVRHYPRTVTYSFVMFAWLLAISVSQGNSAKFVYFDF